MITRPEPPSPCPTCAPMVTEYPIVAQNRVVNGGPYACVPGPVLPSALKSPPQDVAAVGKALVKLKTDAWVAFDVWPGKVDPLLDPLI